MSTIIQEKSLKSWIQNSIQIHKKHNRNNIIIQFKYLFKSHISNKLEIISKDKELSKFVKNIFLEIYTFYKSIMLNNIMIIDDMNFLKYKEFDYHQFETQII